MAFNIAENVVLPQYARNFAQGLESGQNYRKGLLDEYLTKKELEKQSTLSQLGQQVMGGDRGALSKYMAIDPTQGAKLQESLQGQQETEQDFLAKAAVQLENTPEEQRPQVYDRLQRLGVQRGIMTQDEVEPYSPAVMDELAVFKGQAQDIGDLITTPEEKIKMDTEKARLDIARSNLTAREKEIELEQAGQGLKRDILDSFAGTPKQKKTANEVAAPVKANDFEGILTEAEDKLNKSAQYAMATGDDSLLKAAKAQYDVAMDKYELATGKDIKDAEYQAAGFSDRMNASEGSINQLGDVGLPDNLTFLTGSISETLKNYTASPEQQLFMRAANDWIRAKLRKESGAVIGDQEMKDEYRTYFPVAGDTPEVIEAKKLARDIASRNMQRAGSRALRMGQQETPQQDTEIDYQEYFK